MTTAVRRLSRLTVLALALSLWAGGAMAIDTSAKQAILLDVQTGTVLFEKNADERTAPSSMSKIMTAYMIFERLRQGRLNLNDMIPISEKAWRMRGSRMFIEVDTEVSVEDLIQGIIVQSGNDACIAIAEALSGTEEAFAAEMTQRGEELGLRGSNFANASGWPDPNHYMTVRDLSIVAVRLVQDFPEYYHYFSETEFTYNDIRQPNRNPLLYVTGGADGLKTGYTQAGGYGIVASAIQGDQRLVLVLNGFDKARDRAQEAQTLLAWGFREFRQITLFRAGDTVREADVWMGDQPSVPMVVDRDLTFTLPRAARQEMKVEITYDTPVPAPIQPGQQLGSLTVTAPGFPDTRVPLKAGAPVARLGPFGRFLAGIKYMALSAVDLSVE